MPPPQPLTRTPAPKLDFSRPGTPAVTDFDDIYFSTDGGLEETRAVFLQGCGLPDGWQDRDVYTIAELGFGSGLNFLATWQAWQQSASRRKPGSRLHFVSVEGFPFERDDLRRALSHFPELERFAAPLIESSPGPVKGLHRRQFGDVTLTLVQDEVRPALQTLDLKADAWFLDGFSPAKNPDMWGDDVMGEVARLSAPNARLATFTVAGLVRRALEQVGFTVERREGFGRKRHRLEARFNKAATETPKPTPVTPTIIGTGIAGASIAHAFVRRGIAPRMITDPTHPAASGNGAALVKPRFDLQDNPASRFFLSSFLYAREFYKDSILQEGVRHQFTSDSDQRRYPALVQQAPLGPGHLRIDEEGVDLPTSLVIDTEAAREEALSGIDIESRHIEDVSEINGPIILASGYGVRQLLPDLAFRFSRGQLSWADGHLNQTITYGGYAIPRDGRLLLGATHDRIADHDAAFALRDEDNAHNLEQALAQGIDASHATTFRVSVRVNSADTLPRILKLKHEKTQQDIWVLSGLGSRGFVFAPLLGEALVSDWMGEPSPLSQAMRERLSRPLA
ncbi:MAG: tRNA (5-methylaminomethyl-2-thiouridine)(34)-methyltransferase MnmD [Pseudomonadota bacterium]